MRCRFPSGGGRQHFCSDLLEHGVVELASAGSFFSFAFSISSCRKRFASDNSGPPNLAVHF